MLGGNRERKFPMMFLFPLLAQEFVEEKGGHAWRRIDLCSHR